MLEEPAGPRGGRGDALLAVTREDLDLFGVSELEERIELLEVELARGLLASAVDTRVPRRQLMHRAAAVGANTDLRMVGRLPDLTGVVEEDFASLGFRIPSNARRVRLLF